MIGLDLAKRVFQARGADASGKVVFRKRLRREQVLAFFAGRPACMVAMEACSSAHYWAREIGEFGHAVRLIADLRKAVGLTYSRAWELCQQLEDHSREVTALRGLERHHTNLLEMQKAQHFAEEAIRVAKSLIGSGGEAPSLKLLPASYGLSLELPRQPHTASGEQPNRTLVTPLSFRLGELTHCPSRSK